MLQTRRGALFDFPPLPGDEPLKMWDSPTALKQWLNLLPDPKTELPQDLARNYHIMMRDRISELTTLRKSFDKRGFGSKEVDYELATILYKRKLCLWMTFPIREFPAEILTHIFRYVVWSSTNAEEANFHRLHLTWVCHKFRAVALRDQSLWNSVWTRDRAPWSRSLAFIERAGTSLIDLRIDEKEKRPGSNEVPPTITVDQINHLLDHLLPKISQIRILVVVLHDIKVLEQFQRRFAEGGRPEVLERYELHETGTSGLATRRRNKENEGIPLSYHPTPKLRWFCINGTSIAWDRFPSCNLRTLDLRRIGVPACPTPGELYNMLRNSPSLFKLSFDAAGPRMGRDMLLPKSPVFLPNLRELSLADITPSYAVSVLGHIRAPAVRILTFLSLDLSVSLLNELVGLFPEVRMLSLYSPTTRQDPLDIVQLALLRWFESMPRVQVFKLADHVLHPNGPSQHIIDVSTMNPSMNWAPEDVQEFYKRQRDAGVAEDALQHPMLWRDLQTFVFQAQAMRSVATFLEKRKAMGYPVNCVYYIQTRREADEMEQQHIVPHTEKFLVVGPQGELPEERAVRMEANASAIFPL